VRRASTRRVAMNVSVLKAFNSTLATQTPASVRLNHSWKIFSIYLRSAYLPSPRRLCDRCCLSVCLSVCLSLCHTVSRITEKVMVRFR